MATKNGIKDMILINIIASGYLFLNKILIKKLELTKIKKDIKEASISIRIVLEKEVSASNVDEATGLAVEGTRIIRDYLTPRQCYNILRNVSDNDCMFLGFNPKVARPEDLIISRFPVPPVVIRPSSKMDMFAS